VHAWRLVVDIYEPGGGHDYPIVRHVFAGDTREEAEGYFDAHMKTDAFLRGCVTKQRWRDVDCDVEAWWVPPGALPEE
jgi:hypothetical protein